MKWQTQGLSLIELMISLFIASIITLLLYQSLNQSRKMIQQSEEILHVSSALPRAYNQLEKDITGIFVTERFFKEYAPVEKEKEKKTEPLQDIFVATVKEKTLDKLSFFSTHSLSFFGGKTPYAVRVVYYLLPSENNTFTLMRQESSDLTLALSGYTPEKIKAYALLHGIKELTIEYIAYQTSEKKEGESENKKPVPEEIRATVWGSQEGKQKSEFVVPAFVRIKGSVFDAQARKEYSFEWLFEIAIFDSVVQRIKALEKIKKEQENKKDKPAENGKSPNVAESETD